MLWILNAFILKPDPTSQNFPNPALKKGYSKMFDNGIELKESNKYWIQKTVSVPYLLCNEAFKVLWKFYNVLHRI